MHSMASSTASLSTPVPSSSGSTRASKNAHTALRSVASANRTMVRHLPGQGSAITVDQHPHIPGTHMLADVPRLCASPRRVLASRRANSTRRSGWRRPRASASARGCTQDMAWLPAVPLALSLLCWTLMLHASGAWYVVYTTVKHMAWYLVWRRQPTLPRPLCPGFGNTVTITATSQSCT